jgi:diguanylate cyclase (GGDEF)-like protein
MTRADHAENLERLHALDRALAHHGQWMARLNRQLICGGEAASTDLAEDAHLRCQFGAWFSGPGRDLLGDETDYAAIEATHRSMHEIARHLLTSQVAGRLIDPADYDAFMAVAARFRQLLRSLEQTLMERMGAVDRLTGVWNRQAVHLRLSEEVERVQRTRHPCALCYLDIDRFAEINTVHGQRAGDTVLQGVANFLAGRLRAYDSVFRIGGEEFLLCLPATDLDQAATLIHRLRQDLASTPFEAEGKAIRVTASCGVVALDPIFFIEELLEQAERAQLIAKREGGNGLCIWRDGLEPHAAP